jgi:hypothetical protein
MPWYEEINGISESEGGDGGGGTGLGSKDLHDKPSR